MTCGPPALKLLKVLDTRVLQNLCLWGRFQISCARAHTCGREELFPSASMEVRGHLWISPWIVAAYTRLASLCASMDALIPGSVLIMIGTLGL